MADWEDVRRIALGMPGAEETVSRGAAMWRVGGTGFVWERPLRRPDLAALGIPEQEGPVLGAKVDDEAVKHALVAEDPDVFFTTPHFDGHAAVLIRLDRITERRLREVVAEAWHTVAPPKLRREWLDDHPD